MQIYWNKENVTNPTALVWNTNMAAVTSRETLSTGLIVEQYNSTYLVDLE